MPLLVRLRPNLAYVGFLALGLLLIVLGAVESGFIRYLQFFCGALILLGFGAPLVVSTVFRVPVLTVDAEGARMPLMGVRLQWTDMVGVRQVPGPRRTMLVIYPRDPQAVINQARPWVRGDARRALARFGSPITLSQQSMDHTLDEIQSAFARLHPRP